MKAIMLPQFVTLKRLLDQMVAEDIFDGDWSRLTVMLPPRSFAEHSAIAFLCTWGMEQIAQGREIAFHGDDQGQNYLSRLDLFKHLSVDYKEEFNRHNHVGRFMPIQLVDDVDSALAASNAICDLVLHQFDDAHMFLPAMEWAVYEIIDNVRLHSNTPVPGAVSAQFYPKKNRLDIAIVDCGRGLKASLSESRNVANHKKAINLAIQRGVTRDSSVGQGNGMAGSADIVRLNSGNMHVWTGNQEFTIKQGKEVCRKIPSVAGTGVFLRLDTTNPVNLGDTFMGESDWSYINVECERIQDEGGIKVADECVHTGGREPATMLRRKIEALLPEMEGVPVIINFEGTEFASSSFLDELLGRLADQLGEQEFRQQVVAANMSEEMESMANVVINQRLHGL